MLKLSIAVAATLSSLLTLSQCSTDVSVGQNGRTPEEIDQAKENPQGEGPINGSCFGTAEKLPADVQAFCDTFPEDENLKTRFATIYTTVCEEKKFALLSYAECGWTDPEQEKPTNFLKVLGTSDRPSDVNPGDLYFKYAVAYSATLPRRSGNRSVRDLIVEAYKNPEEYRKNYRIPSGTEIAKLEIRPKDESLEVDYRVTVTTNHGGTKRATKFDSRLLTYSANENTEIILDHAFDNFSNIVMRNHMMWIIQIPDDKVKIVVMEEREVTIPKGSRSIATDALKKIDLERMETFHENARK